jgi:hypothetical protein
MSAAISAANSGASLSFSNENFDIDQNIALDEPTTLVADNTLGFVGPSEGPGLTDLINTAGALGSLAIEGFQWLVDPKLVGQEQEQRAIQSSSTQSTTMQAETDISIPLAGSAVTSAAKNNVVRTGGLKDTSTVNIERPRYTTPVETTNQDDNGNSCTLTISGYSGTAAEQSQRARVGASFTPASASASSSGIELETDFRYAPTNPQNISLNTFVIDEITTGGRTFFGDVGLYRPQGVNITNQDLTRISGVSVSQGTPTNGSIDEALSVSTNQTESLGIYAEATCHVNDGTKITVEGGTVFPPFMR